MSTAENLVCFPLLYVLNLLVQKHKSGSSTSYSCVVFIDSLLEDGAACLNTTLLDAMLYYDVFY